MNQTIGQFGALYAQSFMENSPAVVESGDRVEVETAPDGTAFNIVVKVPHLNNGLTYVVPPYTSGSVERYFENAINFAYHNGYHKVQFPKASYQFQPVTAGLKTHLQLANIHDLVIDWQGSTLNFVSYAQGITITNCQRLNLINFNIDWPNLLMSSLGTVSQVNTDGTIVVTVDPGAAVDSSTYIIAVTSWDRVNNQWSLSAQNHEIYFQGTGYTYLGGQQFQMRNNNWALGDSVIVRFGTGGMAIFSKDSNDISFDNVNIYSGPSFGFLSSGGRGLRISNSSINRLPGRNISTVADAIHISNVAGDIIVEGSTFAYQGDDGLNINAPMTRYTPSLYWGEGAGAGQTPSVGGWGAWDWSVGDTIGFFTAGFGYLSSSTITSKRLLSASTGQIDLAFSSLAPTNTALFADLNWAGARYLIQNNSFLNNRARGMIMQSPFGVVKNNTFSGQTVHNLYITSSTYWGEGAGAQNVIISGNQFSNTGQAGVALQFGAVAMHIENQSGTDIVTTQPVYQNLIFYNNTFSQEPGPALFLSSANNVIVQGNTINNSNAAGSSPKAYGTASTRGGIVVTDVNNVYLSNNSFSGSSGPVSIDTSSTSGIVLK